MIHAHGSLTLEKASLTALVKKRGKRWPFSSRANRPITRKLLDRTEALVRKVSQADCGCPRGDGARSRFFFLPLFCFSCVAVWQTRVARPLDAHTPVSLAEAKNGWPVESFSLFPNSRKKSTRAAPDLPFAATRLSNAKASLARDSSHSFSFVVFFFSCLF